MGHTGSAGMAVQRHAFDTYFRVVPICHAQKLTETREIWKQMSKI
jgi:hypothetical protein